MTNGTDEDRGRGHRADIDGLRGIAVLAAVLFHAGLGCPGGYVGVDVFFVISGYLITRQVAADLDAGRFSLLRFWERRIRRIWPAAIMMTAVVLVAGWLLLLPGDLRLLANDAAAHLAMLANERFRIRTDYSAPAADTRALLHTWSLSVEEQFYLVMPLLLASIWRIPRRQRLGILAVAAGASFALSWATVAPRPRDAFYLLPTRAWELLCGSLATLAGRRPDDPGSNPAPGGSGRLVRETGGLIALAAILGPCLLYDRQTVFPGPAALPVCLGAVCLLRAGETTGSSIVGRLLSAAPLRAVGLVSYSLYLWHWPVLALARSCLGEPWPAAWPAAAAVVIGLLTWLSWRFVETPWRRVPPGSKPLATILVGVAAAGVVAAGCLLVRRSDGAPGRFSPAVNAMLEPYATAWDLDRHRATPATPFPALGVADPSGCGCFLLWGDSHGMAVSPAIDAAARAAGATGVAALRVAAAPLPGAWQPWGGHALAGREASQAWIDDVGAWIRRCRPRHVLLCARWSMYVSDHDPEKRGTHLLAPLADTSPTPAGAATAMRDGLIRLLDLCRETDAELWLLLEPPHQPRTPQARALAAHWSGRPPDMTGVDRSAHALAQAPVTTAIAGLVDDRLHVVDLAAAFFNEGGVSRVGRDGATWYADATHVSRTGARVALEPLFEEILARIAVDCAGGVGGRDAPPPR